MANKTENKDEADIFIGCEDWKSILEKCGAIEVYNKIKDTPDLTPPKNLIFECFRYFRPQNMVLLILGQDPYPIAGDACGLAFATNTGNCPKSLKPIYDNLVVNGLCDRNINRNGNLKPWASQGVLLLNTSLSTVIGKSKVHSNLWNDFTMKLMKQLNELPQQLCVFMWGGDAKSYAKYFTNPRHILRTWTHPSPMSDNKLPESAKFKHCDHFTLTKNIIQWNPEQKIMIWTDGACSGNGNTDAVAGFSCMLLGGYLGKTTITGKVRPNKYNLDSNEMIVYDEKSIENPTNNRGELLGILYALWALNKAHITGEIELITDSEYARNTLEDYYPKRLLKGTEKELVNLDLLDGCHRLICKMRKHSKFGITHTRSHKTFPDNADDRTKCIHAGNEHVDLEAVSAKDYKNYEIVLKTSLPALLKYKKE